MDFTHLIALVQAAVQELKDFRAKAPLPQQLADLEAIVADLQALFPAVTPPAK